MPAVHLTDRAVLSVTGADARAFLQSLVTCDVDSLAAGDAAFGALLSPQGKILFDFLLVCTAAQPAGSCLDEFFLLDTAAEQAAALVKRLTMYKLRAKVAVALTELQVVAAWGDGAALLSSGTLFRDPRSPALGTRGIVERTDAPADLPAYEAHRIAEGTPKSGIDYAWGDAFPHEANMDLLGGVSFTKGCYVGQEVVSRMEHRGTARRRMVKARFDGAAPAAGSEIRAGETLLGFFGSSAQGRGIAAVRIDRLEDVRAAGTQATADGTPVQLLPMQ